MSDQKTPREFIYDPANDRKICVREQLARLDEERRFQLRRLIREGHRKFLCTSCFQNLHLAAKKNPQKKKLTFYYKHYPNSEPCPQKQGVVLSDEEQLALRYNGLKEGQKHKDNKIFIADTLKNDKLGRFEAVEKEQTFREVSPVGIAKQWRRPDVSTTMVPEGHRVVFELQMCTTYIDVIIARENFYRNSGAFVVWVLLDFNLARCSNLDIAYGNMANLFLLTDEAKAKSKETGELWFHCYYNLPDINTTTLELNTEWHNELVPFSALTFDSYFGKVFYKDIPTIKAQKLEEIALLKKLREETRLREEKEKLEQQAREERERVEKQAREEKEARRRDAQTKASLRVIDNEFKSARKSKKKQVKNIAGALKLRNKNEEFCKRCNSINKIRKMGRFTICTKCAQLL
ncbi:hypothetical protein CS022_18215 [Veronia nyctiphanis]|uniref:Uncharacterized protein n=1 Tax=Veronia nyctiphanis TaxID=1278244 RepID=A0A4Q0YNN1_9GAMM|nr:DUF6035 family protein [Veronia nyctiphanis]RXJ72045.1 hypothetical protein CS022_18115 [Veronia nyctiphanis]RXJ72061.1 hypothetical protein CS022_18215 [Veronia nyctiphanis]